MPFTNSPEVTTQSYMLPFSAKSICFPQTSYTEGSVSKVKYTLKVMVLSQVANWNFDAIIQKQEKTRAQYFH